LTTLRVETQDADRSGYKVQPQTRYAKSGDVHIAYQVVGDGPFDLVLVPGAFSHVELWWEEPSAASFLRRLASFSRLILFDKRGTGLSDRVPDIAMPTLEERMDDVRAVMDAVGSQRAALFGFSEGGPMCALFAAAHPERTRALVLYGSFATWRKTSEHPWGLTPEIIEVWLTVMDQQWGEGRSLDVAAPSAAGDERMRQWVGRLERLAGSPGAMTTLLRMNLDIDVRHVLSAIHVPSLVLHRTDELLVEVGCGRHMAGCIPAAKYVELSGADHLPWVGDVDAIVGEIQEFLTGAREAPALDRVLATVMFTDIVGSTKRAAELGDRRWLALLDEHHTVVRRELARYRGTEVKTTGDGFLATFDGPARAIRCARSIVEETRRLGLEVRTGLHTGECEMVGDDVRGIAVHTAARVAAAAASGEVLVSSTVKDLVAGAGIRFVERGTRPLKGVPGKWGLFAVDSVRA
jgi:class 3 adenylate cyclase/alpha-beta hydrolase superfamily lysophospholipase